MWKCPSRGLVFPFFYLGGATNKNSCSSICNSLKTNRNKTTTIPLWN